MQQFKYVFLTIIILSQVACITNKQQTLMLDDYRSSLSSALNKDLNTEEKIDILGESLVSMMKQSLEFKSTVKAGKFVKKFGEQNSDIIQNIIGEIQTNVSDNPMAQMGFAMSLMQKPYVGELIELLPQFEQKFKRIAWVANTLGKISKPLGMLGGKSGGFNLGNLQLNN